MQITNWKMDFDTHKGLLCTPPCDMYSILYDNGIISDPYYGLNEKSLFDLSRKDATFYASFSLSQEELNREKIELVFYGIDTICDIYFNGTLLDSVMNMHRMYEYDVKSLSKSENEIKLHIKSPIEYFEKMEKIRHVYMDGACAPGACHLRKALYMSGWDWAPSLPNMGIFRPVEINCYDYDKLGATEIIQSHENGKVNLEIKAELKHNTKDAKIVCEIDSQTVTLENGAAKLTIESPRLWWPNGYGAQNLYTVKFYLYKNDTLIDTQTKKIGLRTLKLCRENDEFGQEFCFEVNGIKIFAMGSNYVPIDSLPSRETEKRLEKIIKDCLFANFNCVRVWGGAYYPRDYFYELCDKYGLIIWQDFMVACANVWLREEFEEEFKKEAVYNIKRIRHHASLGLLCGNNEMEEAVLNWDCADGDDPLVRQDYLKLYEDILPKLCSEHAPYISYIPSSPTSGGGFDYPQDNTRGDVHFWDVWHGNCQFDVYRKHKFRFCSEYGFESLPCIKTVEAFCPPSERNLLSETMESHQKCANGNVKILSYLAEMYQLPKSLAATVYATQLNQGMAIKYGVEHFRRCRGYTMGSVYWQLNDSWPVASWSSIDYFGRYKALHYFAKKFYQKTALGLFNEEKDITINVSNESLNEFCGYIKYGVRKNDFTPVYDKKIEIKVGALSSSDIVTAQNSDFNGKNDTFFYAELYSSEGVLLARNIELGTRPKHFKLQDPKVKVEIKENGNSKKLLFSAVSLAKNVQVSFKNYDIVLSDNYFDLSSSDKYEVDIETELTASELYDEISIMSVYDIALKD